VQQLRGIGPLIASALVAMIGDARQFKNGRHVAVALGGSTALAARSEYSASVSAATVTYARC
jgi:transposase